MIQMSKLKCICLWGIFYSPLIFSACDLEMKNVSYFHQGKTQYKVSIKISQACAQDSFSKRTIQNVELSIHNQTKKISTIKYDEGFWMPGQKRFLLKRKEAIPEGCLKGNKTLQLNLKKNFFNSLEGLYLNLENGYSSGFKCKEMS